MKNIFSLLILTSLFSINSFGKTKKVKISGTNVKFTYVTDSSSFSHKETKQITASFYHFYEAVHSKDYEKYLSFLSPKTKEIVVPDKLERKFNKLTRYGVHLIGSIAIRHIRLYPKKTKEENPVIMMVVKLPEGQMVENRCGFEPIRREKFENVKNHLSILITQTDKGYKIVIPH